MIKYLLDTNICIYIIKKKPEKVIRKLIKMDPSTIALSVITWSELIYGAEKSENRKRNLDALKDFSVPFEVLPWAQEEARHSGELRANLAKRGLPIGPFDCQIAAQALAQNLILVTNNEKEFNRVPGLKIQNWAK